METTVYRNNKNLRLGYTTGSCAAGAAKAAMEMLMTNRVIEGINLMTPKGLLLDLAVHDVHIDKNSAKCAIQKDAGDDPDVTDKLMIYAEVSKTNKRGEILIDGGLGVGRVSLPGLECEIGSAAINSTPCRMIKSELQTLCDYYGYKGGLDVVISVPGGEQIAKRTFNPRLGIIGGISILGTSGIVEPMSEKALVDTIKTEINMKKALGHKYLVITPGNYGNEFVKMNIGFDESNCIKCSNFVGDTIDYCIESGIDGMLLIGHFGKLVKIAGGVMNTHSRYADCRMEIIAAHASSKGLNNITVKKLLRCVTVDEALNLLEQNGMKESVLNSIMNRIDMHLKSRAYDRLSIEAITFTNKLGLLGQTPGAKKLLAKIKETYE